MTLATRGENVSKLSSSERAPTPKSSRSLSKPLMAVFGVIILLATANWVCSVLRFQVNVVAWDQWDFCWPLFNEAGWWSIYSWQHGPHRQGLGFVMTAMIHNITAWDSRVESLWIVSLLVVSSLLALRLKRELTGSLRLGDVWIPLLVLSLTQVDTVITTPNASHSIFPFAVILLLANLWLSIERPWKYAMAGLGVFILLFSGFGLFAGLVLAGLIAIELARCISQRNWRTALWSLLGLGISLGGVAAFLHGYVFNSASDGFRFPYDPALDYLKFLVLMLAHPAGFYGEASGYYLFGGGVLVGAVAGLGFSLRHLARREGSPRHEVLVFLIASSLLFALNTTVGRVHLGTLGGMVSRYITLLIPLFLGLGVLASMVRSKPIKGFLYGIIAVAAINPFLPLAERPVQDWPGTAGLSARIRGDLEQFAVGKMVWVNTYLATDNVHAASHAAGPAVFPNVSELHFQRRLQILKDRKLSFFAEKSPVGHYPWGMPASLEWSETYAMEGKFRWMNAQAVLHVINRQDGYISFSILNKLDALPPDAELQIHYKGRVASIKGGVWPVHVEFPCKAGRHDLIVKSLAGARVPASSSDSRLLSYQLSRAVFSKTPSGRGVWFESDDRASWLPTRSLERLHGFHGWKKGHLGWTDPELRVEGVARESSWLNVEIAEVAAPGWIEIERQGQSARLPIEAGSRRKLSIPVSAAATPFQLTLRHVPAAPRQADGAGDKAMCLRRLILEESPRYEEIALR